MKPGPAIAAGALLIIVWGFRILAPYEAVVPPGDRAPPPPSADRALENAIQTPDAGQSTIVAQIRWQGAASPALMRDLLAGTMLRLPPETPSPTLRAALETRLHEAGVQAAITQLTLTAIAPHQTPPPDDGAALIAAARADAVSRWRQTDARRAARIAQAKAIAAERVDLARGVTATILALQTRMDANTRPAILEDLYRDKIAEILKKAGSVSTVDPKSVSRLILPDPSP